MAPRKQRRTLSWRIRQFPDLPEHYMQPKRKHVTMTVQEAGRLRWAGMSPEERSEFMRQVSLEAWKKRKKKQLKKSP